MAQIILQAASVARVRTKVFQAHAIAAVASAASMSEIPADEHCTETVLALLRDMLDDVAAMLEPGSLARASAELEVKHG